MPSPGLASRANKHACHYTALRHGLCGQSLQVLGFTSGCAEDSGLTWPLLIFPLPGVMGVLCAQGQRLPGHSPSAAWLQLPV